MQLMQLQSGVLEGANSGPDSICLFESLCNFRRRGGEPLDLRWLPVTVERILLWPIESHAKMKSVFRGRQPVRFPFGSRSCLNVQRERAIVVQQELFPIANDGEAIDRIVDEELP